MLRFKKYFFYSFQIALLLIVFVSCKTTGQVKTSYDLVKDFGAVGDGVYNNYAAFQKAARTLSGSKNKTLNIPKGRYYIQDYKIVQGPFKNNISDIVFHNANGLSIEGNNSFVFVNGNFKRTPDYEQYGVPYKYASKNTVTPFVLSGCKNVTIKNINLNGGVLNMEKDIIVVEGWCYGIMINDDNEKDISENIRLENIRAELFATDGIYIRANGKKFILNKVVCSKNGRQGLSIVKGHDILITNSRFDSTGINGSYGRHAPSAGIDLENEGGANDLTNVIIKNSIFKHNAGFQLVSTASTNGVFIDSCYFEDLMKGYGDGLNGIGIYSNHSTISNSVIYGMFQIDIAGQSYKDHAPFVIKNNIIYSGRNALLSADYAMRTNITGNILVMLPEALKNQYFPYIQNSNANFSSNVIVYNEKDGNFQSNKITGLVQYVSNAENNYWLLGQTHFKKIIPVTAIKNGYYTIAYDGAQKKGKDIFPTTAKKIIGKTIQNDFLNDTALNNIFDKTIFTEYSSYGFNKKLFEDANEIRNILKIQSY